MKPCPTDEKSELTYYHFPADAGCDAKDHHHTIGAQRERSPKRSTSLLLIQVQQMKLQC